MGVGLHVSSDNNLAHVLAAPAEVSSPSDPATAAADVNKRVRPLAEWGLAALALTIVFVIGNFSLVTGKDAPLWDAMGFFAPAYSLVADHARAGRFLLWNPWVSGGSPDYAEPELGAVSPVMIAIGAISGGTPTGFRFYYLCIWLLGPLGLLLLARHLGVPPWAALVVGLSWVFCGFYTGHGMHTSSIYSFSWVPLILWRFDKGLATRSFWPALQAGALWGVSALGGYPELTILTGGFLLLWAIGRCICEFPEEPHLGAVADPSRSKRWRFAVLCFLSVVVVGTLVLSPPYGSFFVEGHGYSDRVGTRSRMEATSSMPLPAGALLTFSSPYLMFASRFFWQKTDNSMVSVYLGCLIPIFGLFALSEHPGSRWRWWLTLLAGFAFACSVGSQLPLRGWLYDYVLPMRYFRNPALFREYAMLCVTLLALLGLKDLQSAIERSSAGTWRRLAIVAAIVSVSAIVIYVHLIEKLATKRYWLRWELLPIANYFCVALWLAAVLLCVGLLTFRKVRGFVPILLVMFAAADALMTIQLSHGMVSSTVKDSSIWRRMSRHNPSLELTPRGLYRQVITPDFKFYPNNDAVPNKVATFETYDTMTNRFQLNYWTHPVLVEMATGKDRIWFSRDVANVFPTDTFYEAFVARSEALGAPVLLVHPSTEMPKIREHNLTTQNDGLVTTSILNLSPAERARTNLLRYTPNHLDFSVTCPDAGWLLVTDRWARGWSARVNGKPAEVYGGNFIFRAVRVEAGENRVEFSYRPFGFPALVVLSWGTLAAVFVGVPLFRRRARTCAFPSRTVQVV